MASPDTPAILCTGLGKTFAREGDATWSRLKAALGGRRRAPVGGRLALADIDLQLARGRGLGVVGPSGAGKSTLLRMLAGRLSPDAGAIRVNGRVAALCDADFGLRPQASGRQNLRANRILADAAAARRADAIVAFAGAADHLDDPVHSYSTGMRRRLGLAIALHGAPEVLLIDDALSDADARFERQCREKIAELKAAGAAVVLVARAPDALEATCEDILWLEGGRVREFGPARRLLRSYRWHNPGETNAAQEPPAPFIIWTFRRTGGTHLGQALFDRAMFDDLQHEPFNPDRVYGHVTRHWTAHADETALRHALEAICQQKWLIKHCLEMVPPALNRLLAEIATEAGYRHVFVYRRNPLNRLLSLQFAERSGAWDKAQAARTQIDEAIFSEPLPVEALLAHEASCREGARAVYAQLRELGQRPVLLAFEDLFLTRDMKPARRQLHAALAALGLSHGEAQDDAFVAQVLAGGEQGTRAQYTRFADYERLRDALAPLGEFELRDAAPTLRTESDPPRDIETCSLWAPVPEPVTDCYTLAGLVLLAQDAPEGSSLHVEDGEGVKTAVWGLPSQRLSAAHPENPRAAHARFEVRGVVLEPDVPARLMWRSAEGESAVLATVQWPAAHEARGGGAGADPQTDRAAEPGRTARA